MKKNVRVLAAICIVFVLIALNISVIAQEGPPPPPTGGHGQTTNVPPQGGNAPVGNGIAFLLSLGIGYGIATISKRRIRTAEEIG